MEPQNPGNPRKASFAPPPCVVFEDEHLLVVDKPAGLNTHAPAPFAGEGIYDWLRHREPRWAALAIIHRLDKETSGLLVFGKTPLANRSLTEQFTRREVRKKYLFLTDRRPEAPHWRVVSHLQRAGERYVSRPGGSAATRAETWFQLRSSQRESAPFQKGSEPTDVGCYRVGAPELNSKRELFWLVAQPLTGRTHQIRVHAAESGCPILGDELYGGSPAPRLCLHAAELVFQHPATAAAMWFESTPPFEEDPRLLLRQLLINAEETDAFRLLHGAADGSPGWYVDVLGQHLLVQSEGPLAAPPLPGPFREAVHFSEREAAGSEVQSCAREAARAVPCSSRRESAQFKAGLEPTDVGCHGSAVAALAGSIYHKQLNRQVRRAQVAEACPRHLRGPEAPETFVVRENGVRYELSFREGYSVGLFLDQRDNRRRFLTGHVAAGFSLYPPGAATPEVLNVFAYTCAFSVCAALGGARATSLDLSKKYLEWGKRNFTLNGLDPAAHDFIYGDAFDWLKRLAKKARCYEVIVLDPPTFSQSKEHGVFRAEKDYGQLAAAALPLLRPGGVLLASTNAAGLAPEKFLEMLDGAIRGAGRRVLQRHYAPQPPDFPITRDEPGYLKTVWLRIA